jgi:chromatin structure-remodeling complex subunit RSC1/2
MQPTRPGDGQADVSMGNTGHFSTIPAQPAPAHGHTTAAYPTHYAPRPSATPVPVPQYGTHTFQSAHVPPPQMTTQTPQYQPHSSHQTHHTPAFNGYPSQYNPSPVPMPAQSHHPPPHQMTNPIIPYDPSQRLAPSPARNSITTVPSPGGHLQANTYNPPRPIEVYKLDDATNDSIPADVREQFVRDESGHVLFFTQPPLDRAHRGVSMESADLGHSARYLADRARGIQERRAKRKARDEMRKAEEMKRSTAEQEVMHMENQQQVDSAAKILLSWAQSIQDEANILRSSYGGWSVKDKDIDAVRDSLPRTMD